MASPARTPPSDDAAPDPESTAGLPPLQPLPGVLRNGVRPIPTPGSPRPFQVGLHQRQRSDEFFPLARSLPGQRSARFESPLQHARVIAAPPQPPPPPQFDDPQPAFGATNERLLQPDAPDETPGTFSPSYSSPDWEAPLAAASETTRLLGERLSTEAADSGRGSLSLSTSGSDRLRHSELSDALAFDDEDDPVFHKSVCMLGFSILTIISVVFVIVISGLTTLVRNHKNANARFSVNTDWPHGAEIPLKYGCLAPGGKAQSFPLTWHNPPPGTTNLVVLFANPGAIGETSYDPVHWFVTDIPVVGPDEKKVDSLPANASMNAALMPAAAQQRENAGSKTGTYYPPCPKQNSSLFIMHVYAIDASAVIGNFSDARQIMSRFVGVPTAKYAGTYGTAHRDLELVATPASESQSLEGRKGNRKKPGHGRGFEEGKHVTFGFSRWWNSFKTASAP